MDYGRAQIVDADDHDRVIALVETQGAAIGDVPAGLQRFDDEPVMQIEDSPTFRRCGRCSAPAVAPTGTGPSRSSPTSSRLQTPRSTWVRSTSSSRPRRSTSRQRTRAPIGSRCRAHT